MNDPRRGTTLIEVLVAVTLLSVLITGIALALNAGLTATERTNQRFFDSRRVTNAQRILEAQIEGLIPVIAECLADPSEGSRVAMPFFQGEPTAMRFVSAYSLQGASRGVAQIVEYTVIPRPKGDGYRLVVNEWPYAGARYAGEFCLGMLPDPLTERAVPMFRPIETGPASFVLADELAQVQFQFQQRVPPPEMQRWVNRWIGPGWPTGVRILMTPQDPNAASVLPMPLAVPVRARKDPNINYLEDWR